MHRINDIVRMDLFSVPSPTGTKRWDALLPVAAGWYFGMQRHP